MLKKVLGRDVIDVGKLNYCTLNFFQRIGVVKMDFIAYVRIAEKNKKGVEEFVHSRYQYFNVTQRS